MIRSCIEGGTSDLHGKEVVFSGRLAAMHRREATELVEEHGGTVAEIPSESTSILVVGGEAFPLESDGRLTRKLHRVRELRDSGHPIEICGEEEFFGRLSGESRPSPVLRLYTSEQLSRILKIPVRQIRTWVRAGLIRPVREEHHLHYFDYAQVAGAKALSELARDGASIQQLRRRLERLSAWLPRAEVSLSQLGVLERDGEVLVRLDDGQIAEASGQLRLDFEGAETEETAVEGEPASEPTPRRTPTEWFELGAQLEDLGRLQEARDCYLRALAEGGPRAEVTFNLANVLYGLGEVTDALERFLQTVEIDPNYVEAWNNLGSVFSEIGNEKEAIQSFQEAIKVAPTYADAHYNLAESFAQTGRMFEAARHWREYLLQDPYSTWAEHVRDRLSRVGVRGTDNK